MAASALAADSTLSPTLIRCLEPFLQLYEQFEMQKRCHTLILKAMRVGLI